MMLNMLKAKLHCATVTQANLKYMGSITSNPQKEDMQAASPFVTEQRIRTPG